MNDFKNKNFVVFVGVVLVIAAIGYYALNIPDRRDAGQKIGDAINELHNGPEKAARQLEDRTPGDKLEDVIQDKKEDVKKSLNQE